MPVILRGLSRPSGERRISNRPHETFRIAQHDNSFTSNEQLTTLPASRLRASPDACIIRPEKVNQISPGF